MPTLLVPPPNGFGIQARWDSRNSILEGVCLLRSPISHRLSSYLGLSTVCVCSGKDGNVAPISRVGVMLVVGVSLDVLRPL